MQRKIDLIKWFSVTTALYIASRMFCSAINQSYLLSLGYRVEDLFKLYAFQSLALSALNVPISLYSDTFSRKSVVFSGLSMMLIYHTLLLSLAPLARSSWHAYGPLVLYAAELPHNASREILFSALNGWVVDSLPAQDRDRRFAEYSHRTQAYQTRFSAISGAIGILLSLHSGYSYCYAASVLGLTITVGLFGYIALHTPACRNGEEREEVSTQKTRTKERTSRGFSAASRAYCSKASLAVRELMKSPWSAMALMGFMLMSMARLITYHFWQPMLLGSKVQLGPCLGKETLELLLPLHFGMYLGQYITNQWIRKPKAFSREYYARGGQLLGLGVLSAAFLAWSQSECLAGAPKWLLYTLITLAFSLLQSAVAGGQILQDNLFVRCTDPKVLATCLSLMHLAGRLSNSVSSYCLHLWPLSGMQGFALPGIALSCYLCVLRRWGNRMDSEWKALTEAPKVPLDS